MKEHPVIWLLGVIATCVVFALGGLVWAEDRYQHKIESDTKFEQMEKDNALIVAAQDARVDGIKAEVQWASDRQEKRRIDDNLFKLEQIAPQRLTDNERAQIAKYKRDLKALVDYWTARGRQLQ
jgi:hypothetical protein